MTRENFILEIVIRKIAHGETAARSLNAALDAANYLGERGYLERAFHSSLAEETEVKEPEKS
jgi:hypothetical protein